MTHTSTEQPVAYLWQHTITGQTKALMRDDVFTAGPHWRLVGPLRLATESGPGVHMATASVPGAAPQPPAVKESLTPEPAVNQQLTVPTFSPTAQRKLTELQSKGFRVVGYTMEHCNVLQDNRRCTVDYNGLVRRVPSAEQEVAKERAARQAAQVEVAELKGRIARAGIEQRRAVLEEREACAKACEGMEANRDWVPGSLWGNIRGEMAAAIRARQ